MSKTDISNRILDLANKRDEVLFEFNEKMFELITHNIIAAFDEMCQLPDENIDWMDIEILYMDENNESSDVDNLSMKVTFALTYYKDQASKYVLDTFGYDSNNLDKENVRIIRFGFPLAFCDASKQEVVDFILQHSNNVNFVNEELEEETSLPDFDLTGLTDDQKLRLGLINTKGSVH